MGEHYVLLLDYYRDVQFVDYRDRQSTADLRHLRDAGAAAKRLAQACRFAG